jgi:hypothetical protein
MTSDEERRSRVEEATAGFGIIGWIDRGAWAAMAQDDPATFSWQKALITVAAGIVLALIIYATFFESVSFVVGLAIVYAITLWRAYSLHNRFVYMQREKGL